MPISNCLIYKLLERVPGLSCSRGGRRMIKMVTLVKTTFMRKNLLFFCTALLMLCCCTAIAQDQNAMMKAWEEYKTPGEMHKWLASCDGEWTADVSMWMDPGKDPMKTKGSMTNKMIMGGRYQEAHYKGDFMGQPMEGTGTTGYNNASKKFETTWIDNMGSGTMMMAGTMDPATKTISFTGSQTDPMTGKEMSIRETLQMVDDNTQLMTMYMTPEGGSEMKTMEIKYTKKK